MRKMFDAAYPPGSPPKVDAVAGYIGGGTPHVWSDSEWASMMSKSGAKYKLPIFVRVPPTTRDPVAEAKFCLSWASNHGQPKGTLIALDYETAIDATYLNAFDQTIVAGGYKCIVYGSRRSVIQNPKPSGGYWTATWNNVPHLDAGATITQYGGDTTLGQPYDLNVVADGAPLWGGVISPPGGLFMALTDAEQAEILRAARQVNAAVGKGQTSFETTIEAILGTIQAHVNEERSHTGAVLGRIDEAKSAIINSLQTFEQVIADAISALPGLTDEQRQKLATDILAAIAAKLGTVAQ